MISDVATTSLLLEGRGYDPTPQVEEEQDGKDHEHDHLSAEERLAIAAVRALFIDLLVCLLFLFCFFLLFLLFSLHL